MGLFKRFRRGNRVDSEERSPQLGLKYRDLVVLNEIAKRADLSRERHVVFYLYAPSPEVGEAMAEEARAGGYTAEVHEPLPEYPKDWCVCGETRAVLSPDFVRRSVDFFEALAQRHHATYDGWEAEAG